MWRRVFPSVKIVDMWNERHADCKTAVLTTQSLNLSLAEQNSIYSTKNRIIQTEVTTLISLQDPQFTI